jgi:4-alpha-glucanotransferase
MQFSLPIEDNAQPSVETEEQTHAIAYTGTHDNQTTLGWYLMLTEGQQKRFDTALDSYQGTPADRLVQYTLDSHYEVAVIPMQDILSLDDEARMNVPGTIQSPNWEWKMRDFKDFEKKLTQMKTWVIRSQRVK